MPRFQTTSPSLTAPPPPCFKPRLAHSYLYKPLPHLAQTQPPSPSPKPYLNTRTRGSADNVYSNGNVIVQAGMGNAFRLGLSALRLCIRQAEICAEWPFSGILGLHWGYGPIRIGQAHRSKAEKHFPLKQD